MALSPFRLLQSGAHGAEGGDNEPYEFVAFIMWYLFLVLCCVIPTCCAYRRRRLLEARLNEQQLQMHRRIQQSNLLFFNVPTRLPGGGRLVETERTRLLAEELAATTLTLSEEHFVDLGGDDDDEEGECGPEADNDYLEENVGLIQLLPGDRKVAGLCTICLCAYAVGEELTYSGLTHCPHAFHKDCLLSWLGKQEEPKCPVCRQDFCRKPEIAANLDPQRFLSLSHPYPFAAALESLEGRTIEISQNGELHIRYSLGFDPFRPQRDVLLQQNHRPTSTAAEPSSSTAAGEGPPSRGEEVPEAPDNTAANSEASSVSNTGPPPQQPQQQPESPEHQPPGDESEHA